MHARLPLLCALVPVFAVGGPPEVNADVLIVLNKSDHEAVLVDPATLQPVARIPTGRGPRGRNSQSRAW